MSIADPPRRNDEAVHLFVERMAMAFAEVGFPGWPPGCCSR